MKRTKFSGMLKAEASSSHLLQSTLEFIFTDFEPNKNRQGVPRSEAENILATAMFMPVKVNFDGKRVKGHADAAPIGPIISVEHREDIIIGRAVIWNEEYPEVVNYLKQASAEEGGVRFSWELFYRDSDIDDKGVEWLKGVIVGGITIVDNPSYGDRTHLLTFAETEDQHEILATQLDDLKREHIITEQALDIASSFSYSSAEQVTSFEPPASVRESARKGLELHKQFSRGGTVVSIARAQNLSNGKSISTSDALRMAAFFAAASVKPQASDEDPSNQYIDWLLWGGDDANAWATATIERLKEARADVASGAKHMHVKDDVMPDQTDQTEGTVVVDESTEAPADVVDTTEQPEVTSDDSAKDENPAEQITLAKSEYDVLVSELAELRGFKAGLEASAARAELLENRRGVLASAGVEMSDEEFTAQSEFVAGMDATTFDGYVAGITLAAKRFKRADSEHKEDKKGLVPDPLHAGTDPKDLPVDKIVKQYREYAKNSVR